MDLRKHTPFFLATGCGRIILCTQYKYYCPFLVCMDIELYSSNLSLCDISSPSGYFRATAPVLLMRESSLLERVGSKALRSWSSGGQNLAYHIALCWLLISPQLLQAVVHGKYCMLSRIEWGKWISRYTCFRLVSFRRARSSFEVKIVCQTIFILLVCVYVILVNRLWIISMILTVISFSDNFQIILMKNIGW